MDIRELAAWCDELLDAEAFEDYCPNGLQVHAGEKATSLVSGVTASQELIDTAIEVGADVLLVHHGYFWKGEPAPLTGPKGRRIRALMRHGINLLAYHLPLDAHPDLGNNVGFGRALGLAGEPLGKGSLLWGAALEEELLPASLVLRITEQLGREPLMLGPDRPLRRIAWCTGAAQSGIVEAAARGFDAYVSGEVSEQTYHLSRELDITYLAAGHHATERFGVQALGRRIAETFDLDWLYVDLPNPV